MCAGAAKGSQFMICMESAPQFDGKRVAFGQVIEGLGIIRKIDMMGSDEGTPQKPVVICSCGQL